VRSLRFLVSRRWLLFFVIVLALAYACLLLGRWQWHRLQSTKANNAIIHANEYADPTPVDQVLSRGQDPSSTDQYKVVSATGTYDVGRTIIVRYQTRGGTPGVDVVVPLVTSSGTALLVDRGWFQTSNQGTSSPSQVPAPPSGTVTVTGWVRQDASGSSAQVVDASARAISSAAIAPAIGIPLYGGFVDLRSEDPAATTALAQTELPHLSNGPHFFYSLQWWFFGILAIFGFCYLAWEEATGRAEIRKNRSGSHDDESEASDSESPEHASVDGQHGAGDEGRRRAEQESSGAAEL
jgi:cytochrome oxidase assembly protein ShyY1